MRQLFAPIPNSQDSELLIELEQGKDMVTVIGKHVHTTFLKIRLTISAKATKRDLIDKPCTLTANLESQVGQETNDSS